MLQALWDELIAPHLASDSDNAYTDHRAFERDLATFTSKYNEVQRQRDTRTHETDTPLTYSSNFTQATSGPAQAPVLAAFLQSNAPHVLQSVNTTHQRELESKVWAAAPL